MKTKLNTKYTQILWANIVILGGGVGYLVFKKWSNMSYAFGAGVGIGIIEYVVMHFSLLRKQRKENER
ncbi:MAG: hypothetical protein JKY25_11245 [Robiginitomaculum sp.]|nr:hypothetical protein [Robiginitomaculum sp.]